MHRNAVTLVFTALWSGCTCAGEVTIAPPRVPQGGRAVAIAVSQSNKKRLIVATESGGLFRTFDGGVSFQHLDGFPTFGPFDVAIASLSPDVVIATARDDFQNAVGGGGGIWRSTDGGASWRRPTGWPTLPNSGCRSRPEAFTISHMPLSHTFNVATDCGIAVSSDDGATFSMMVLNPTATVRSDSLQNRVRSVLVVNRSTGVAADDSRLWSISGGQWIPSATGPAAGNVFSIHAFASPFWAATGIFYHTGRDGLLWFSTNAGATWDPMEAPPQFNREAFIRVGRGLDGDGTHIDAYYGTGFCLLRQAVTTGVPGGSNAWRAPDNEQCPDPADIAFDPGFAHPILLAGDHGVYTTPDNGSHWNLTGSNYGGFVALQIGEVTGRAIGGNTPHLDLYYGTQDNDIKNSADGGKTWQGTICCEGAFLRVDAANPAATDDSVTGHANSGNVIAPAHLGSYNPAPAFRNAPAGNTADPAEPPVQLRGTTLLQDVPNTAGPTFDYFLTPDRGATWAPAFSLTATPKGALQFAGPGTNPVAYIGVSRGGTTPPLHGLIRVQNVTSQPSVRRADSTGINSLGRLLTFQARHVVFGVDPAAPNHLIAPDIIDGQMKATSNGGISWYPLSQLTTAVTDTGRFLGARGEQSFATTIAWDPTNSCHILVGTMQNGVIRSADGGLTWKQVAGSNIVSYVSSFYFPPSGAIWMSAYGRGLWTLNVSRTLPAGGRCQFPPPPGLTIDPDTLVAFPFDGAPPHPYGGLRDTLMCARCALVAVRKGWITDLQLQKDQVQQIAISNGTVVQVNRDGKEVPLAAPNAYQAGDSVRRIAGRSYSGPRHVAGLILDGRRLLAVIIGRAELPLSGIRSPIVYVSSAGGSRVPSIVNSGDSVTVHGYGFAPGGDAQGVDIRFDGDLMVLGVAVGADGRFTVTLRVTRGPGELAVTVSQRDGKRLTREGSDIQVTGRG